MPPVIIRMPCFILFAVLSSSALAAEGDPTPVIVAEVRQMEFVDRVEALGTLRANESVELTANVTESVVEIGFEDGERVKKGQMLVRMVGGEEEALLVEAGATANEAKLQFERAKQLAKTGSASVSALDEARRVYETARARKVAIESQIGDFVIKAPFDGVVGLRNVSVGAMMRPGEMITTLDDDSVMKLDFTVPTTFLPVLKIGTPVRAKARAYRNEEFEGEIVSVGSRIDPVTRSVTVRARVPNPDLRLKPGLLMTVEVLSNSRQALAIPEEALRPIASKNHVFLVQDSDDSNNLILAQREVEVGSRRDGMAEVLSGLEVGERVVTRGAMTAGAGAAVQVSAVAKGGETLDELLESTPDSTK